MTDRSETDAVTRKWALIKRLDDQRAHVHAGVIVTWRAWRNRTPAQQHEIDIVLALAKHQLAECDRMEAKLKQ